MNTPRELRSLDGDWRLVLDPDDAGVAAQWHSQPPAAGGIEVTVPSVWDRWAPDYDGPGWYFRTFEHQADWTDRHVALRFEAADYYAEVWLNGTRLGEHEGGYTPFSFSVGEVLRSGDNLLAVRLVDPHGPEGFGPFGPGRIPCAKENRYWSFAGLWGSVQLEAMPKAHLVDVFVQPDIRRKRLTVETTVSGPGTLHLQIEGTPCSVETEPGVTLLDFPEFELWSPEHPRLYTLRADLIQEDGTHDSVSVRFGMREFTVKDNRFYLNNRPIYIKGVLHQPDYPRSLAAPESEAQARAELMAAKEAGFNLIRLHVKTPPRITLELGDELGMLFYEEPPIGWLGASPKMRERCECEVREMVLRDRNHPSVVVWGMLNDSGNAGHATGGGAQALKDALCALARSLDPSRVIVDDSGGVNTTGEPARLMRPYRDIFETFDDLRIYQRGPVDHDIERYYRHNGQPNQLCFLSGFGFGGPENLADTLAQYGDAEARSRFKDARFLAEMLEAARRGFAERKLDRVFGDFDQFLDAARRLQNDAVRHQIDAVRANPKIGGYCLTQLCDAGNEFCAGVLDRWRRPKPVHRILSLVQRPVRPIIQMADTNLVPRQEAPVTVILANEDRLEGRAELSLQVVGPTNQVLWKKKRGIKLVRHGRELWQGMIAASGSTGTHKFVVRVTQDGKRVAESAIEVHVIPPAEPAAVEISVVDPARTWTRRCTRLAKAGNVLAPIHVVPPLANTIRAYPDNELMQVLAQVRAGAVAIFFGPPDDWNDLAEQMDANLRATPKDAVGGALPVCHYAKLHPVFDRLPARGVMRQPYRNVVPAKTFLELGDEDIAGAFDTRPLAAGDYHSEETAWWGNDILVRRHGSGRVVFTHLRVLEHLGRDVVADRLFVNLVNHFARRSVPGGSVLALDQNPVEWMRAERSTRLRRWMVVGEIPNWDHQGHDAAYPPERELDFTGTYPGWYRAIHWRAWYARAETDYEVDLQEAFTPVFADYPRFDYAVGYAYAEFNADRRDEVNVHLAMQNATKVWLNGTLVYESDYQAPHDRAAAETVPGMVRQGRNTVLVKCTKIPGPFRFSIDFTASGRIPMVINWWK